MTMNRATSKVALTGHVYYISEQQGVNQIYSHGKGSQLAGKVVKDMDVISTNKGGINIIYQGLT